MYPVKTPRIVKWPFPELIWKIDTSEKSLYLTFDDGPIPGVTDIVLDMLKEYNAKAVFFVVGENAKKHPLLIERIIQEGHTIGNHTFNHLNGWKTNDEEYLVNVEKCQSLVSSSWFRPPYGKIRKSQIKKLKDQYKIAMWDVLSGDFDESINGETCAQNVVQNVRSGSIIVFHDSIKAWPRLKRALPECLKQLTEQGYSFKLLD